MVSARLITALAAFGISSVAAQAGVCSSTITVASPAEATISCRTVQGDIVFEDGEAVAGQVSISGPETIEGDLIIKNATKLISLSSTSISRITGKFQLDGLQLLSTVTFSSLQTVGQIEWIALPALETLSFGTAGVTTVDSVRITNTFLSSLDGLNLVSVDSFQIDNNGRLAKWSSQLGNITSDLKIFANSGDLVVDFPDLIWVNETEVRDVKEFNVPALIKVNHSMEFDGNSLTSFIAPNLTETGASLSFINNDNLNNLSFPALEVVGGSLNLKNNQALTKIDGFPKLRQVGGAITLRGNFTEAALPSLGDVKGSFDVASTEDITSSCSTFDKKAPKKSGGDGSVQGKYSCAGNVKNANDGGKDSDKEDGAGVIGMNVPVVLAVALLGVAVQLL